MKKPKKHVFAHRDPETEKKASDEAAIALKEDLPAFVKKDFVKVIATTLFFTLLIVAFYFISLKTTALNLVYKIFGI